jgi:hypothetical protein
MAARCTCWERCPSSSATECRNACRSCRMRSATTVSHCFCSCLVCFGGLQPTFVVNRAPAHCVCSRSFLPVSLPCVALQLCYALTACASGPTPLLLPVRFNRFASADSSACVLHATCSFCEPSCLNNSTTLPCCANRRTVPRVRRRLARLGAVFLSVPAAPPACYVFAAHHCPH